MVYCCCCCCCCCCGCCSSFEFGPASPSGAADFYWITSFLWAKCCKVCAPNPKTQPEASNVIMNDSMALLRDKTNHWQLTDSESYVHPDRDLSHIFWLLFPFWTTGWATFPILDFANIVGKRGAMRNSALHSVASSSVSNLLTNRCYLFVFIDISLCLRAYVRLFLSYLFVTGVEPGDDNNNDNNNKTIIILQTLNYNKHHYYYYHYYHTCHTYKYVCVYIYIYI